MLKLYGIFLQSDFFIMLLFHSLSALRGLKVFSTDSRCQNIIFYSPTTFRQLVENTPNMKCIRVVSSWECVFLTTPEMRREVNDCGSLFGLDFVPTCSTVVPLFRASPSSPVIHADSAVEDKNAKRYQSFGPKHPKSLILVCRTALCARLC